MDMVHLAFRKFRSIVFFRMRTRAQRDLRVQFYLVVPFSALAKSLQSTCIIFEPLEFLNIESACTTRDHKNETPRRRADVAFAIRE
jgi:hypothetical protein